MIIRVMRSQPQLRARLAETIVVMVMAETVQHSALHLCHQQQVMVMRTESSTYHSHDNDDVDDDGNA